MEAIYDRIGDNYDTTRKADPQILSQLQSLLNVMDGKKYLDVACGTGNYTSEISDFGGDWYAFDQSKNMLKEAEQKSSSVVWDQYNVDALGYTSNFFDGALCSLAIHHFPCLASAFAEVSRVLKPGSGFVIFTATPEQMQSYWLCHYFPVMMERSCEQMPSREVVQYSLENNGFILESSTPFFVTIELADLFLYSGKQRAEMYLSEKFRKGISSFSNYCSKEELQVGLEALKADINSGDVTEVMSKYESSRGDYLFLLAKKV